MKVLQVNLGRGRSAHDLAFLTAEEEEAKVIVVSEPNKKMVGSGRWLTDTRQDVAIYLRNKRLGVKEHKCGAGFEGWNMVACYISPNCRREDFESKIDEIMTFVRDKGEKTIALGDLNSKSTLWGEVQDARDEYLSQWLATLDMTVANDWGVPTFERGRSRSVIDVPCSRDV